MKTEPLYITIKQEELENNFIYNSTVKIYKELKKQGFEPIEFSLEYIQDSNQIITQYDFKHNTKIPSPLELKKIIEKTGNSLESAFSSNKSLFN